MSSTLVPWAARPAFTYSCAADAFALLCRCLADAIAYEGEMPGNKRKECGNYQNLDMTAAKVECKRYLDALIGNEKFSERKDFSYE